MSKLAWVRAKELIFLMRNLYTSILKIWKNSKDFGNDVRWVRATELKTVLNTRDHWLKFL
jgi:hypothetical protein